MGLFFVATLSLSRLAWLRGEKKGVKKKVVEHKLTWSAFNRESTSRQQNPAEGIGSFGSDGEMNNF